MSLLALKPTVTDDVYGVAYGDSTEAGAWDGSLIAYNGGSVTGAATFSIPSGTISAATITFDAAGQVGVQGGGTQGHSYVTSGTNPQASVDRGVTLPADPNASEQSLGLATVNLGTGTNYVICKARTTSRTVPGART